MRVRIAREPNQISNADWHAVVKKDRHADGKFVYAAVTTGIYCRPSCPARNPHRRNTLVFITAAEAERRGYVPCLRCHPKSLTPGERSIAAALDYIEVHLDQTITLDALSEPSGLSAHHLQEIFKRIVGVSPKAYCDAQRIARFKQLLRAGQSISRACYEVGYGSSRALYEKTRRGLGMTPAIYRRGGVGVQIFYATIRTTLGRALVARTEEGVCSVLLGENEASLLRELRQEFSAASLRRELSVKRKAARSCQRRDPLLAKFPVSLQRRIFEARIWKCLQ